MQILGRLLAVKERAGMIYASVKSAGTLPLLARIQTAVASSEVMRFGAERLLLALTTGESPFGDPNEGFPSAMPSSAAASVLPASASTAGLPPTAAVASLLSAASSPQ